VPVVSQVADTGRVARTDRAETGRGRGALVRWRDRRPTFHEACPVGDDGPTPDASFCPLPAPPTTLTLATSARCTSRSGVGVVCGSEAMERGVGAMRAPNRTPRGTADPAASLRASARHARGRNRAMGAERLARVDSDLSCTLPYREHGLDGA
jgi:hypothetical protein